MEKEGRGIMRVKTDLVFVREPNGRRSRSSEMTACAPAEIRRLRDAAIAGVKDAIYGTQLGRIYLQGKITEAQLKAGIRWGDSAHEFYLAIDSSGPNVRALVYERRGHGHPPDPESDAGVKLAAKDVDAAKDFQELHAVLKGAGQLAVSMVRSVCERDEAPVGENGMNALDHGLAMLAQHMGLTVPPKYVR